MRTEFKPVLRGSCFRGSCFAWEDQIVHGMSPLSCERMIVDLGFLDSDVDGVLRAFFGGG